MKNKTFISFLVNVLIGILFSFPVLSSQNSVKDICINSSENLVFNIEVGCNKIVNVSGIDPDFFPDDNSMSFFHNCFNGNYTPGNKDKIEIKYSPPGFKEIFTPTFVQSNPCLNRVFVNLAYLEDLRNTKMLS